MKDILIAPLLVLAVLLLFIAGDSREARWQRRERFKGL
jgi:hypothetical protein